MFLLFKFSQQCNPEAQNPLHFSITSFPLKSATGLTILGICLFQSFGTPLTLRVPWQMRKRLQPMGDACAFPNAAKFPIGQKDAHLYHQPHLYHHPLSPLPTPDSWLVLLPIWLGVHIHCKTLQTMQDTAKNFKPQTSLGHQNLDFELVSNY